MALPISPDAAAQAIATAIIATSQPSARAQRHRPGASTPASPNAILR